MIIKIKLYNIETSSNSDPKYCELDTSGNANDVFQTV